MPTTLSKVCTEITPSTTLRLNALVAELRAKGQDIIGLAAGEPDFRTPDNINAAANQAIKDGQTYYTAVSGVPKLRQAVCDYLMREKGLSYTKEQILVGTGAKQVLHEALIAIVNPGDEVILPAPCWLSYPEMVRMAGGVPVVVETDEAHGFLPTREQLEAAITPKTKAVMLNTPNNPTGVVWGQDILKTLAELAVQYDFYIISDEIYEKMVYDGAVHVSAASISPEAYQKTIVVSGFSKAYAMTGWRLGYAAGPKDVIDAMCAYQSHATGNTNTIAQYAGIEALNGPQDSVKNMVEAFSSRRQLMLSCIEKIPGVSCAVPQGAFYVLLNVKGLIGHSFRGTPIRSEDDLAELLLEHAQVSVVPGSPFYACGYLRLSYAISEESIIEAMRRMEVFAKEVLA